jgi:hypothetical protein
MRQSVDPKGYFGFARILVFLESLEEEKERPWAISQ